LLEAAALEAAAFVADDLAPLQALLFVVAIQLGSGDVAIFHIVVLAHFGRRLSGLVIFLDRFGTLVFFSDSTHGRPVLIDRASCRRPRLLPVCSLLRRAFDLNLTAIAEHNSADRTIFPAFFRRSV
jgi:hypothetical protein